MNGRLRRNPSLAALKQPEYTGENRCIPCTALNLVLAAVGSVVTGALLNPTLGRQAAGVGLAAFLLAGALIYFRGYLVPGTPTITKRYFPDWLLRAFDKTSEPRPEARVLDEYEPETLLREVGIVAYDPAAADLGLDPEFAAGWTAAIERYRGDEQALKQGLGELSGVAPERIDFVHHPRAFAAWVDEDHLASWPSMGAAVADVAAAEELPQWDSEWTLRPLSVQAELLGILRLFLDTCPSCDGEVLLSQDVVESCCRSWDVVAATCLACDDRLFEVDVDAKTLAEEN